MCVSPFLSSTYIPIRTLSDRPAHAPAQKTKNMTHNLQSTTAQQPKDIEALASRIGKDVATVTKQIQALEEVNPMLVRPCLSG